MAGTDGDRLRLANAALEVELDAGLGAEILAVRRPGGPNVLATYEWASPLPLRRSRSYGDPELDWLADYRGGWQELFPNAGAEATVDGVPLPFHGEVSRARWEVVEAADTWSTLRCAARLPLVIERTMRLTEDPPALRLEETVRADAPRPTAFLLGHHPAFLASEGARIDLPGGTRVRVDADYTPDLSDLEAGAEAGWPSVPGRDGGAVDLSRVGAGPVQRLAFLSGLGPSPWAAVRGGVPGLGAAMAWDPETFRCAWFWWEIGGPDLPWYGRARIVAIEPNTDLPADGLAAARARGTAHELAPGGVHRSWLTFSLFEDDGRPVRGVGRDGSVER